MDTQFHPLASERAQNTVQAHISAWRASGTSMALLCAGTPSREQQQQKIRDRYLCLCPSIFLSPWGTPGLNFTSFVILYFPCFVNVHVAILFSVSCLQQDITKQANSQGCQRVRPCVEAAWKLSGPVSAAGCTTRASRPWSGYSGADSLGERCSLLLLSPLLSQASHTGRLQQVEGMEVPTSAGDTHLWGRLFGPGTQPMAMAPWTGWGKAEATREIPASSMAWGHHG